MEVWFYVGKGKLFDKLIRWWTNSRYSHCEIVIGGMSYSADAWTNIVRCIPASRLNFDNWERVVVTGDVESVQKLVAVQLGKKYDWLGIFGFLLPWGNVEDPKRWYCSELCAAALGISKRPISPGELYEQLLQRQAPAITV